MDTINNMIDEEAQKLGVPVTELNEFVKEYLKFMADVLDFTYEELIQKEEYNRCALNYARDLYTYNRAKLDFSGNI